MIASDNEGRREIEKPANCSSPTLAMLLLPLPHLTTSLIGGHGQGQSKTKTTLGSYTTTGALRRIMHSTFRARAVEENSRPLHYRRGRRNVVSPWNSRRSQQMQD